MSLRKNRGFEPPPTPFDNLVDGEQYSLDQILELPAMEGSIAVYPDLYAVNGEFVIGFTDVDWNDLIFHQDQEIHKWNLGWIDKPQMMDGLRSVWVTYSVEYMYLFAKHHSSTQYCYLGKVEQLTTNFSTRRHVLQAGENTNTTSNTQIHLAQNLSKTTLKLLRGSEWLFEIPFEDVPSQQLNTEQLIAEVKASILKNRTKSLSISLTQYDDFSISIRTYGDRCAIYVEDEDDNGAKAIDETIPDNRARLFNETISYAMRKTIDTAVAINVIEHLITTGQRPDFVEWEVYEPDT